MTLHTSRYKHCAIVQATQMRNKTFQEVKILCYGQQDSSIRYGKFLRPNQKTSLRALYMYPNVFMLGRNVVKILLHVFLFTFGRHSVLVDKCTGQLSTQLMNRAQIAVAKTMLYR